MVATVRDGGGDESEAEPEPGGSDVRAEQERAERGWDQVANDMFDGVRVHRTNSDGRRPLVMNFVDVLVQISVVKQPKNDRFTMLS